MYAVKGQLQTIDSLASQAVQSLIDTNFLKKMSC